MVNDYRDLIVWQKSMDLAVEIYALVKVLPREEMYSLSDQMRRAAVSIPSNIAEGHQRSATKDYLRFLRIAKGSNAELQTQILLCERLQYFTALQGQYVLQLSEEISRMLSSLISRLSQSQ